MKKSLVVVGMLLSISVYGEVSLYDISLDGLCEKTSGVMKKQPVTSSEKLSSVQGDIKQPIWIIKEEYKDEQPVTLQHVMGNIEQPITSQQRIWARLSNVLRDTVISQQHVLEEFPSLDKIDKEHKKQQKQKLKAEKAQKKQQKQKLKAEKAQKKKLEARKKKKKANCALFSALNTGNIVEAEEARNNGASIYTLLKKNPYLLLDFYDKAIGDKTAIIDQSFFEEVDESEDDNPNVPPPFYGCVELSYWETDPQNHYESFINQSFSEEDDESNVSLLFYGYVESSIMSDQDDKSSIMSSVGDLSTYWETDSPNYYESLVWLIAEGADINKQREEDGMTLLHKAAKMGDVEFAKVLIDHGANCDIQDARRMSPRDVALLGARIVEDEQQKAKFEEIAQLIEEQSFMTRFLNSFKHKRFALH